jgi:hypothetical protein
MLRWEDLGLLSEAILPKVKTTELKLFSYELHQENRAKRKKQSKLRENEQENVTVMTVMESKIIK